MAIYLTLLFISSVVLCRGHILYCGKGKIYSEIIIWVGRTTLFFSLDTIRSNFIATNFSAKHLYGKINLNCEIYGFTTTVTS